MIIVLIVRILDCVNFSYLLVKISILTKRFFVLIFCYHKRKDRENMPKKSNLNDSLLFNYFLLLIGVITFCVYYFLGEVNVNIDL